jgi:predicted lipoprotein with Yx(FWY)xxD motif
MSNETRDGKEPRMLRRSHRFLLPLALVVAVGVGGAMAAVASTRSTGGTVTTEKTKSYGTVLASSGRTLYRFTSDGKGVSRCVGSCAQLWPSLDVRSGTALKAGSGVDQALLGTVKRSGGARQVTYAGFPLYRYSGDKSSGATAGEGVQGKWFLVNTKGALVKKAVSSSGGTHSGWG